MVIVYLHYSHLPLNEQLYYAAGNGRTEEVVRLLGEGADPNCLSEFGSTALHAACINNYHQSTLSTSHGIRRLRLDLTSFRFFPSMPELTFIDTLFL